MALTIREAIEKKPGENLQTSRDVLRSNLAVGETLAAMGRIAEGRQAFARLREAAEARLSGHSDDHERRALVADGDLAEGRSLIRENRLEDAKPFIERALKTFDELVRAPPRRILPIGISEGERNPPTKWVTGQTSSAGDPRPFLT